MAIEPTPKPLNIVYTIICIIDEVTPEYYTIEGIGARFFFPNHTFSSGDRIRLTIQKDTSDANSVSPPINNPSETPTSGRL